MLSVHVAGEAVAQLYQSEDCCEVDPSKCAPQDLSDNQNNLRQACEEVFQRITASCEYGSGAGQGTWGWAGMAITWLLA